MTGSLIDLVPGDYQRVEAPKAPERKAPWGRARGYDPDRGVIRVWHVSPFDFDKFSLEHLGTGDGHSTHAYGQYFAEHRMIGGYYGKYWHYAHGRFTHAELLLRAAEGDRQKAIEEGQRYLDDYDAMLEERGHKLIISINKQIKGRVQKALEVLKNEYPSDPVVYDVALRARPEQFLQFEPPLPKELWEKIESGTRDVIQGKLDTEGIPTGRHFYRAITKPEVLETLPHPEIEDPGERAAKFMLETMGLVGARYLDQRSRRPEAKIRTYNYTVWDPSIIEIVKKYGGVRHKFDEIKPGGQHATVKREITADHLEEHSNRDTTRQAPEAGGSHSS
jgi:hypothetical protein